MAASSNSRVHASHRVSYLKTTLVALGGGALCLSLRCLLFSWSPQVSLEKVVVALLWLLFLLFTLAFAGGLVVLYRDARDRRESLDLFYRYFNRIPASRTGGWRYWTRPLLGPGLRPGDLVRVREAADILATLDKSGKLDGLPFMPEMLAYRGKLLLVDRRIDKINDWMGGNELRRTKGIVTLVDARCSGAAHGTCQAACQILWNERWLCRVPTASAQPVSARSTDKGALEIGSDPKLDALEVLLRSASSRQIEQSGRTTEKYTCQITELVRASAPMSRWDVRQDLRPLMNGNLSLAGFLVALLTAAFNKVQGLRHGAEYPVTAPQLDSGPTPIEQLNLQPGELVQVRSKHEIGLTLHKNHNRGMWFGKETLRFCNQRYRVRSRIERIINERSGEVITLHTPGVILDSVCGSGEFLRLCPQNEYVFWREIWLRRVENQ
jgi:hypothetical protein